MVKTSNSATIERSQGRIAFQIFVILSLTIIAFYNIASSPISSFLGVKEITDESKPVVVGLRHSSKYTEEFNSDISASENELYETSQMPDIAWLLSFPNSGTSYTLSLVRKASLLTTAANYGREKRYDGPSVPYRTDQVNGPFLHKLELDKPSTYILTKTHCGGYCANCSPKLYVISKDEFQQACLSGKYEDENAVRTPVSYDIELVKRAVYLLRNPFDNIVSRFHLDHNERTKEEKKGNERAAKWLKAHPRNETGFYKWCSEIDKRYGAEILEYIPEIADFQNVLCLSEFFKYIQWHNHASKILEENMIPLHVIYYEDYDAHRNKTLDDTLSFLELPKVGTLKEFHLSDYSNYYSDEQRAESILLVNKIASNSTREKISRYLDLL